MEENKIPYAGAGETVFHAAMMMGRENAAHLPWALELGSVLRPAGARRIDTASTWMDLECGLGKGEWGEQAALCKMLCKAAV